MAKTRSPSTSRVIGELARSLAPALLASISRAGCFGCVLRAAVAKSLEFAAVTWREPPPTKGFFQTATLRGICEDLIVLQFIGKLNADDQNRIAQLLMKTAVAEGLAAQAAFIGALRPWQPILPANLLGSVQDREQEIRGIAAKLGWTGRTPWPSVWFMAKACSEESLYSYLYSATSKWVHFSPQVLLRMGWGGSKSDVNDQTEWHFTTAHFEQYYKEFNRTYSLYLLIRLLDGPAAALVPPRVPRLLDQLRSELEEQLRWPEAVTFEEMNAEVPGPIVRILLRVAHQEGLKKTGKPPGPTHLSASGRRRKARTRGGIGKARR